MKGLVQRRLEDPRDALQVQHDRLLARAESSKGGMNKPAIRRTVSAHQPVVYRPARFNHKSGSRSRKMIEIKGKGNWQEPKEGGGAADVVDSVPGSFHDYPPVKGPTTDVGGL